MGWTHSLFLLVWVALSPTIASANNDIEPQFAEPCRLDTVSPVRTLCLHGTVWDSTGASPVALNNITVTIYAGTGSLTAITAPPYGQMQPTFGLDISSVLVADLGPFLTALGGVLWPPSDGGVAGAFDFHDHLEFVEILQNSPIEIVVGRDLPLCIEALLNAA